MKVVRKEMLICLGSGAMMWKMETAVIKDAEEDFEGDLYIRKLVIDYAHQKMGIGTDAMEQFIQMQGRPAQDSLC